MGKVCLSNDEAKWLTMTLVEDRSGLREQLRDHLKPYGQRVFNNLCFKIGE